MSAYHVSAIMSRSAMDGPELQRMQVPQRPQGLQRPQRPRPQDVEMQNMNPREPAPPGSLHYWRHIFDKYDTDHDNRISYAELREIINSREYEHDIPENAVGLIMQRFDQDNSGHLDFDEFHQMVTAPELSSIFGHFIQRYVHFVVPARRHYDTTDGQYEEQYKLCPPPVTMIIISLIEIGLFIFDASVNYTQANGPAARLFIYNPHKRYEAWRFITYMFVHVGWNHLVVNLMVQILLGIPLEMVHRWWRVIIVYGAGVMAGSLATSIIDPEVFLAGASGGVYALIAAHVATIVLNWSQMEFAVIQLLVFIILVAVDVGTAIYNRYVLSLEKNIGYVAHLAGAVAGLLVGIGVLKNLEVRSWEKIMWWVAIVVYFALMTAAILTNVFWTEHFPISRHDYK